MSNYYTDEKNILVLLSLLKAHDIKKIIVSPGATNISFVASIQQDSYFELYSAVDERSASYMACGLALESGEPVVLSCTGATASQNYLPGFIEAYYSKLPILAITSTQPTNRVGHLYPQVTDRSILPNDVFKENVELPIVLNDDDLWECEVKVNSAILSLSHHSKGPVFVNVPTSFSQNFNVKELPKYRVINRINQNDEFPELDNGKIAIFIGSHTHMSTELTESIDRFCENYNSVVFCDHTSGYNGKYKVLFALAASQQQLDCTKFAPDLIIHLGEISGDYFSDKILRKGIVWRVNEDGEIRDKFRKLRYIFEMPELVFFNYYLKKSTIGNSNNYFKDCKEILSELSSKIQDIPFSNIWVASQMAKNIPQNSTIHFAILNSLRSWNFFELPNSVKTFSNVGGFGIEGNLSSLIGASFVNKDKLYYSVIGDLAFFYDINILGNRHVSNNIRVLLVNNGKGIEFRNFGHAATKFGQQTDDFIAAAGHFGNKSKTLVKNIVADLGFEYLCASNKEEFDSAYKNFVSPEITERPLFFEVFTDTEDESNALKMMRNLKKEISAKKVVKTLIMDKSKKAIKNIVKK